jgi:hypothetical protein
MSAHQRVEAAVENPHEALEIVNPTILRLVTEISDRTGETSETVIETALLEHLERLQTAQSLPEEQIDEAEKERRERVYALVSDMRRRIKETGVDIPDPGEYLYGEDGLPR